MDVLDRFQGEYQEVHKISEQRRRDQLGELRAFSSFAGKPIEQCDANDFSGYMGKLSSGGLHVNTVAKRMNMIRPFFRWGFQVGVIDADTYMRVKEVSNPNGSKKKGKPRPYNRNEMRQLWQDVNTKFPRVEEQHWVKFKRGTGRYRNVYSEVFRTEITAVIRLALDCGLRREEIYRLTIDDVHPDNAGVAVRRGKEGRSRQVPYTDAARAALDEWLRVRRLFKPNHRALWLNLSPNQPGGWAGRLLYRPKGELTEGQQAIVARAKRALKLLSRPLSFEAFEKMIRRVGPYELHRLRHTCATNWLRAGTPIQIVQKLLGHEQLQQTLLYTELLDDDVQAAVERNQKRFEEQSGSDG